uniref:(California timema) hypothetical protein n=1 Tax=Timema californicum TaxID=61474 RepID=A0A7R9J2Z9_TIMCA|nr:unnamed protein product [Timema californicum]
MFVVCVPYVERRFHPVLGWMYVVGVPCSVPCVEPLFHLGSQIDVRLQNSRHGNTNQELNSAGAMPLSSCHLVNGTNPSILKRCRTSSPTADLQQIQTPAVFGLPFPLKRRTPSPYTLLEAETDVLGENSKLVNALVVLSCSTAEDGEIEVRISHFFHPITPSNTELLTASVNSSIQLVVTNLDQTIEPKEMKRVLLALFREHVMVIHISVFTQTDGNVAAHVKVPSLQDAQYAISQLHRRKIGFKRMLIAYANGGGPSPQLIRSQIVSLLLEVPGHSLPLFKFRELFESRYLSSISVSDMYKMKDVCIIKEDPSGRMVSLNPDHRNTPSPSFGVGTQDGQLDLPYCTLHPQRLGAGKGWAEQDLEALPNFRIGLNILAERIHTLLHSHNGSLPLPSLLSAWKMEGLTLCCPSTNPHNSSMWSMACVDVGIRFSERSICSPYSSEERLLFILFITSANISEFWSDLLTSGPEVLGSTPSASNFACEALANALVVLSSTAEDGKIEVRISVGLPNCYQVQFNKLEEDKDGVPLEHLVSCLPGIEIYQGASCVKYLRWTKVKPNTESQSEELKCVSPPLATQLALFSRELVDLLKTSPHCQLLFNRFIPAYHHHFGRQCRVADYGFTKLIELMEALPNIVQVMGEGNKRVVTLSHRMQVRRFCSDLLRVLKSQATKNVLLTEFPKVYQRVLNKPWDIVDYGVCEMEDLLSELPENSVVVSQQESDVAISIPKREQTLEEIEKTKQFSGEVVELMRHAPQCSMLFSKFIPAYHHHFGHQCRVSDFGFTKLIELFEAIPEVVKIEDASEGERKVSLTLKESLKVLSEQMVALLRFCSNSSLLLSAVPAEYLQLYGHALRPQMYERASLEELMDCIKHVVEENCWAVEVWGFNKSLLVVGLRRRERGYIFHVVIGVKVLIGDLIRRYIEKLRVGYRKAGDVGGMDWEDPSGVREELVGELIRPVEYPRCEKNVGSEGKYDTIRLHGHLTALTLARAVIPPLRLFWSVRVGDRTLQALSSFVWIWQEKSPSIYSI